VENKNVSIWRVMQAGPATVLKTDGLRKWLEFDSTISPPNLVWSHNGIGVDC